MRIHLVSLLVLLGAHATLLAQVNQRASPVAGATSQADAPLPPRAIMRLGTARFSDVGRPFALSFSRDGKALVAGSWDGAVTVWEPETRKLLREWDTELGSVRPLALSPDGTTLATAGRASGIRVWLAADGEPVKTLTGHKGTIDRLAYSPDGKCLVSAGRRDVRLWDLNSGQSIYSVERYGNPSFSADGSTLTILCRDGGQAPERNAYVVTVDVWTGKETKRTFLPPGSVPLFGGWFSLFSSGRWLIYADGGTVRVNDLVSKRHRQILESERRAFTEFVLAPDERCLAVADADRELLLVELATGQVRSRFPRREGGKTSMAFSPDGRFLACGSVDRTVLFWDLTGRMADGKLRPVRLSATDLARLWDELNATDGTLTNRALWQLVAGAADAVPFLGKKLHNSRSADANRVADTTRWHEPRILAGGAGNIASLAFGGGGRPCVTARWVRGPGGSTR